MIKNNNLFDCLNWILKKSNLDVSDKNTSFFMLNRWLSMVDKETAHLVNSTTNRWIYKNNSFTNDFYILKFLKSILPKSYKKINYIRKKTEKEKEHDFNFLEEISNNLQISQKELRQNLNFLNQIYDKKTKS